MGRPCALQGPEALTGGQGMEEDWAWRNYPWRKDMDHRNKNSFIYLVGPRTGIPLTNDPSRPTESWFGYSVNAYKGDTYEPSIFEVTRKENGEEELQTINFANPLLKDDVLVWAGPNNVKDADGSYFDYQLRLGSNTDGGTQRLMRSDEPIRNFPPVRLVVTKIDEADVLDPANDEYVEIEPLYFDTSKSVKILPKEPPKYEKLDDDLISVLSKNDEEVPAGYGGVGIVPEKPSLGRSLLRKFPFGKKQSEVKPQFEEKKESLPEPGDSSNTKGWGTRYNPFKETGVKPQPVEKIEVDEKVISEKPAKSFLGSLFGKSKTSEVKERKEEVIRPMGHAREPIVEDILVQPNWFSKQTGAVRSLLQRLPKGNTPATLQRDREHPVDIELKEKIFKEEPGKEELIDDEAMLLESGFRFPADYGADAFGGNPNDFGDL
ncbi:hypothetical protein ABW20_dc0100055 [Dactylellina cionopaga]|nr:hypothetical protein ABW20_dc0100055 [Dactylellina cionopaga]